MKKFAEAQNDLVKKYEKLVVDYNDLVKRWNEAQAVAAAAATNHPAKR